MIHPQLVNHLQGSIVNYNVLFAHGVIKKSGKENGSINAQKKKHLYCLKNSI